MATYVSGACGPFRGKLGLKVGSSWKGINYMRSLPVRKNVTPTARQLDQRNKLRLAAGFVKSLKEVVTLGFDRSARGVSEYNSATAYTLKNALDTTVRPFSILYSKVLVTRGYLPDCVNAVAAADGSGKIVFRWENSTRLDIANEVDRVVLVAYSPVMNRVIFTKNAAARSAETASLDVTPFKGQSVETYIAFLKVDGSDVSQSLYTGRIDI